jgi:hypothetical protein
MLVEHVLLYVHVNVEYHWDFVHRYQLAQLHAHRLCLVRLRCQVLAREQQVLVVFALDVDVE